MYGHDCEVGLKVKQDAKLAALDYGVLERQVLSGLPEDSAHHDLKPKGLSSLEKELLEALRKTMDFLSICYDSSEDNEGNPTMRDIGRAIVCARAAVKKAKARE